MFDSAMSASSAPFAALQPATSSVVGWYSEIDVEPVAVPAAVTSQEKNIRTMAVASRGTRVSAEGYLLTKRREASRVTFNADNAELSERTIGCRRMQARVHFSKASRSAESSLPTTRWRQAPRHREWRGS